MGRASTIGIVVDDCSLDIESAACAYSIRRTDRGLS